MDIVEMVLIIVILKKILFVTPLAATHTINTVSNKSDIKHPIVTYKTHDQYIIYTAF